VECTDKASPEWIALTKLFYCSSFASKKLTWGGGKKKINKKNKYFLGPIKVN